MAGRSKMLGQLFKRFVRVMPMKPKVGVKPKRKCRLLVGRVAAVRSRTMAAIKSKDTKGELALRKALSALRLRYRLHKKNLPGRPDVVFVAQRLAVFCDGDFWHGRNWASPKKRKFRVRRSYWLNKIESNIARDKRNNKDLRRLGWAIVRIWESDILKNPQMAAKRVHQALEKQDARTRLAVTSKR